MVTRRTRRSFLTPGYCPRFGPRPSLIEASVAEMPSVWPLLPAAQLIAADEWVRIPMSHGVDFLDVGAAAAVAFYAVATGRPQR